MRAQRSTRSRRISTGSTATRAGLRSRRWSSAAAHAVREGGARDAGGARALVGEAKPRAEVIHDGVNTLPPPARWQRFQKRFCRPDTNGHADGAAVRLQRRSDTAMDRAGVFCGRGDRRATRVVGAGAVVIDYFQVPDGAVADRWPRVVSNDWRLQRFVYDQTRDFMRRVSTHVSIGAAVQARSVRSTTTSYRAVETRSPRRLTRDLSGSEAPTRRCCGSAGPRSWLLAGHEVWLALLAIGQTAPRVLTEISIAVYIQYSASRSFPSSR
jgi:hypothetical protein